MQYEKSLQEINNTNITMEGKINLTTTKHISQYICLVYLKHEIWRL